MGSLTYTTGTITNGLASTDFSSTGSILTWFGDAFDTFLGGVGNLLNVPLFLAVLFLLGVGTIFISESSK